MTELKLAFGIGFEDLYERAGLMKLDQAFREYLNERDAELDAAYAEARNERPESGDEAKLLMEVAAHLESFIGALFGISAELEALAGDSFQKGVLLYTGDQVLPFGDKLWCLPVSALWGR